MHIAGIEQAQRSNINLARYDNTNFFRYDLHNNYKHTLSKSSIFDCPKCTHCGAFIWKEERKGFCCNSGKIDIAYSKKTLLNPTTASRCFKRPFQDYVKRGKQNSNALASIGVREIAVPGFNPGARIQDKVYHYISGPLPERGHNPLFSQIFFHDPDYELQYRDTHASNSSLNKDFMMKAQQAIHECNPYVRQFKSVIEYASHNDSGNELKIVLIFHTRRRDLHRGTLNLPSRYNDVDVIAPGASTTEQFEKLAVALHLRGGSIQTTDAIIQHMTHYHMYIYCLALIRGTTQN